MTVKHELLLVCTEESVKKVHDGTPLDDSDTVKAYIFKSYEERQGFLRGISAASGYRETYPVVTREEWEKIKGNCSKITLGD